RRNIRAESRLIDDLLDITGLSKGKLCIEREPANVHALLRSAVEMCQAEAQEQGILLETHLGARHPIAQADPRRLIQDFCNLITNAIKFTPRLGKVVIRTSSSEQEMLRIEMSDTGIGIEERQIARIFEPFEQADRSITRRYGGLGLGLALARQLVEAHEGTIRAASEGRGLGATFVIQLPLAPGKPLEIAEPVSVAPLQGSGGARILLVEDHVDTRDALVKLLRRWGYEVVAVGRVDEALRKIEKETFQLLLSDIGLPDASGLELMTAVRTRTSLRGVAMSGFGSQDDIEKTREAGFEKHLTKPVGVEALKRALHEALSN
ncbi:MAG: ATP-binding protein, partial [Verrucomicrobiota bacterium]